MLNQQSLDLCVLGEVLDHLTKVAFKGFGIADPVQQLGANEVKRPVRRLLRQGKVRDPQGVFGPLFA